LTKLLKEKFGFDYPDYEKWIKKFDIDEKSILKQIEIDKQKNEETFNKETINKK
jgi:deoxyadenosine/deoxycytidine kinase